MAKKHINPELDELNKQRKIIAEKIKKLQDQEKDLIRKKDLKGYGR